MKDNRSLARRVFIIGVLALWPAALFAAESADASLETAATPAVEVEEDDGKARTYVIHDEVFVEETVLEIPGSSTIAAKLPLSLAETPLAIDTVDLGVLEDRDAGVLGDALENVSGVNAQSGNGIFDFFTVRGLDSTANGLILVDGAPEPQTAYYQLYNVERVEVLKGPSSFLYGGFSMGGAVNLVRKAPRAGDFTTFGLSGGSYSTWQGNLDANYFDGSERWGVRVNGQWWSSDLHRDGKEAESFAVNPVFTFRAGERTTVQLSLEHIETDAVPDSGLPLVVDVRSFSGETLLVPDVDRERSYDAPFSRSDQEVSRFQADVEHRVSERFLVRNKTYFRRFDWLSDSTSLDAAVPLDPLGGEFAVVRSQLVLDDRQTFTGNQLEALWRVETGSVTHNLLFGLEYARLEDEFTFTVGAIPSILLFNPVETAAGAAPIFAFGTDAESTVVAPYLVDQIRFSDKFQLLLGLRYDDLDFEDALIGLERRDSSASPMIGAVFSPRPGFSIYANAGQAFSPQSTFVVGESREPEESDQVELGFRASRADGKLSASLALFRLDRENVAIPDQTGVLRQTGSQENEGVELEVAGELRPGLTASFAYTWTDAELTEFAQQSFSIDPMTGQPVPFTVDLSGNAAAWVPENVASLWLRQGFRNGWGLAAGGRWVDGQFVSESNVFAIDDYLMVDAAVWYDKRPWRFQVNLDNLTDEETFTRVFSGSSVLPAPGFTARAGIRYGIR